MLDALQYSWYRAVTDDEAERLQRIRRAYDAYMGVQPPTLQRRVGQPSSEVPVNLCRLVVDAKVAALFGSGLRVELVEGADTPAEQWLRDWWQREQVDLKLVQAAVSGAIAGHAFLRVTADRPWPRLVVLDPLTVSLSWVNEDIERVTEFRITWNDTNERNEPVVRRQRILQHDAGTWDILDEVAPLGARTFRILENERWPYPVPPVVHCQNLPEPHQVWGRPDLTDELIQLERAIRFALSNSLLIYRYHGHPRTVAKGFPPGSEVRIGPDEVLYVPPAAELQLLEPSADLATGLALVRELTRQFFQMARVPEIALGRLEGVGAISGVALQILYRPLLEDIRLKRELYGALIRQLVRLVLIVAGQSSDWEIPVALHWPPIVPTDEYGAAQTALLLRQLGVSRETLLERLGFSPELERQRAQDEEATLGEALRRRLARTPDQEPEES